MTSERPNCKSIEPMIPPDRDTGRNATTMTSVMEAAANAISRVPKRAASFGLLPSDLMTVDVLDNDDRVVDEDTDNERKREKAHEVEGEVEERHAE